MMADQPATTASLHEALSEWLVAVGRVTVLAERQWQFAETADAGPALLAILDEKELAYQASVLCAKRAGWLLADVAPDDSDEWVAARTVRGEIADSLDRLAKLERRAIDLLEVRRSELKESLAATRRSIGLTGAYAHTVSQTPRFLDTTL